MTLLGLLAYCNLGDESPVIQTAKSSPSAEGGVPAPSYVADPPRLEVENRSAEVRKNSPKPVPAVESAGLHFSILYEPEVVEDLIASGGAALTIDVRQDYPGGFKMGRAEVALADLGPIAREYLGTVSLQAAPAGNIFVDCALESSIGKKFCLGRFRRLIPYLPGRKVEFFLTGDSVVRGDIRWSDGSARAHTDVTLHVKASGDFLLLTARSNAKGEFCFMTGSGVEGDLFLASPDTAVGDPAHAFAGGYSTIQTNAKPLSIGVQNPDGLLDRSLQVSCGTVLKWSASEGFTHRAGLTSRVDDLGLAKLELQRVEGVGGVILMLPEIGLAAVPLGMLSQCVDSGRCILTRSSLPATGVMIVSGGTGASIRMPKSACLMRKGNDPFLRIDIDMSGGLPWRISGMPPGDYLLSDGFQGETLASHVQVIAGRDTEVVIR